MNTHPPEEKFPTAVCEVHGYDDIKIIEDENEFEKFSYPVCAICERECVRG